MGLENIYGPVESEEGVNQMLDRRIKEKRFLTEHLNNQIILKKKKQINEKFQNKELEQINILKAQAEITSQNKDFQNHQKQLR